MSVKKKGYRFIIECIKYYRAIILYKTGQHHKAIPLLKECVEEVEDNRRLHRLNMLLEALFEIKNSQLIGELIKSQEKPLSTACSHTLSACSIR
ncbi:hypothetical protein [Brevibacillus laterosporus]|uniref:hypothetical protein n=1 Tax=Brevibacillus laterosporus TaxID=1465 RepID=UPI002157CABB|nr:hypothetical protein [Brevibacillus laterosporus]